jgi:hypothetical protein
LTKLVDRLEDPDRNFLEALDWALSPEEEDRPQTVQEWLDRIAQGDVADLVVKTPDHLSDVTVRLSPGDARIPSARYTVPKDSRHASNESKLQTGRQTSGKSPISLGVIALIVGICVGGALIYMSYHITGSDEVADSSQSIKEKMIEPETKTEGREIVKDGSTQVPPQPVPSRKIPVDETPDPKALPSTPPNTKQDDSDFHIASQIDTPEAYEIYLRLHPQGRHQSKALENR